MRFQRWEKAGVWKRFGEGLEEAQALFVDRTKIHVATLDENRAVVIQLTPEQASDCAQFETPNQALPVNNVQASEVLDKGHDSKPSVLVCPKR